MMSEADDTTQPSTAGEPDAAAESATDRLEGSYTEVDGEAPKERTVAGEYTRTDGAADEEPVEGDYTSTQRHPDTHDASEPHGEFTESEPPKPHPGMHHA